MPRRSLCSGPESAGRSPGYGAEEIAEMAFVAELKSKCNFFDRHVRFQKHLLRFLNQDVVVERQWAAAGGGTEK